MAHVITNEKTGHAYTYASLEAYEVAEEWYNSTEKGRIQEFCRQHGVNLNISATALRPDWHDVAMELYARVHRQLGWRAAAPLGDGRLASATSPAPSWSSLRG